MKLIPYPINWHLIFKEVSKQLCEKRKIGEIKTSQVHYFPISAGQTSKVVCNYTNFQEHVLIKVFNAYSELAPSQICTQHGIQQF